MSMICAVAQRDQRVDHPAVLGGLVHADDTVVEVRGALGQPGDERPVERLGRLAIRTGSSMNRAIAPSGQHQQVRVPGDGLVDQACAGLQVGLPVLG